MTLSLDDLALPAFCPKLQSFEKRRRGLGPQALPTYSAPSPVVAGPWQVGKESRRSNKR